MRYPACDCLSVDVIFLSISWIILVGSFSSITSLENIDEFELEDELVDEDLDLLKRFLYLRQSFSKSLVRFLRLKVYSNYIDKIW